MDRIRTAFITGASSGIGAALARRLARADIEVALAARSRDALEHVATDIRSAGGRARIVPLDVTDVAAVYQTMRQLDDEVPIDLVVANAGIGKQRWSGKLKWQDIEPTLKLNVLGATATLMALIERFVARKRGHLVGISSLAAYRGLPKSAVYSGSKAYLSTFLESLRLDLQGVGITVSDIRPGYVRTPMTSGSDKLPFVLEANDAAEDIARAIFARKAVHAFPQPLALGARSLALVPARAYQWLGPKLG